MIFLTLLWNIFALIFFIVITVVQRTLSVKERCSEKTKTSAHKEVAVSRFAILVLCILVLKLYEQVLAFMDYTLIVLKRKQTPVIKLKVGV